MNGPTERHIAMAEAVRQATQALARLSQLLVADAGDPGQQTPAIQPDPVGGLHCLPGSRATLREHGAECGCGLYQRCNQHELARPKPCRCNGPLFASSDCPIPTHRADAAAYPDLDPAAVE